MAEFIELPAGWEWSETALSSYIKSSFKLSCANQVSLLEMIILSAVQSFARIQIQNVIMFITTSTMLNTTKVIG